jgi:putative DNA primase/helicase
MNLGELLALQVPARQFVLEPIIRERDLLMFYSWRGIGKTNLALQIAYAIAAGTTCLRWRAPKARRVLYVDGEMPAVTMQQRLATIVEAADVEPPDDYFQILTPDVQDVSIPNLATPEAQALIDAKLDGIEVLFLDSISTLFRHGRENEAESWAPAQDWALRLRRRGVSVVFIHHEGKGGAQRGTSRREDVLDSVLHLVRPANYQTIEGARFEIHFEKARGLFGDDVKAFEAALSDKGWTTRDIEDVKLAHAKELYGIGLTVRDVAEELKTSRSTAQRLRAQLVENGDLREERK